ncbi:MAG TPA: TonB-dependent receptor [Saprospiraceae bacterium]|nr:TonB-dependent receptor [Saprospiraceae bacterium]
MRILLSIVILLLAFAAQAQIKISGRVTLQPDGEVAIGVTVQLKGSTTGAVTDYDGNYTLTVPDRSAVLVFAYTGFLSQEIEVGNQDNISVVLAENASQLDEVVVTGYGTQKRASISGSVSTVNASEIAERPILRVEQALQGRTAGVQVAQVSGSPGSPLSVRVRGVGTINNSDPLYIVDGVPVDGLDFLNPNDIETVNVLKDAASSAIYGSRGANGVVLITTKGGKRNQTGTISYDGYYGVQQPARLLDLLDAREYAILQNEAYVAAGKTPLPEFANPDVLGEGTDWQEAIFQSAPITSHQLTFAGGGEHSAYTLSGNYFSQDGIVGGDKANFQRATVRVNGAHDLKPWLTLGNNLGFTWLKRKALLENTQYNSPLIRALNIDPTTPVRKADGTYAYSNYADTDIANPVNAIEQTHNTWTSNRLVGNVFGDMKLGKGLSFRSTYSLDVTYAVQNNFNPRYDLSSVPSISEAPAAEKNLVNSVGVANNTWRNWQWENVLTWQKNFQDKHDITLIAGTTALSNRFDASGGANTNLPSNDPDDAYISNTIDPIASQSAYQYASESSLFSWFGRANYELRNTYLFSATFRADGSSRFGKNNRVGYFPSFSAGWIASHESFWNLDAVNFFKLRASWGQNGNDRIGDYSFTTVVYNGQNYTFGSGEVITNGSVALSAANPDLKWETSTQTDIGLDMEFFEGRFNFTTDYYIKKTSDMLYAAPIPLVAGTAPPIQNVANAENRGWELTLNYRNRDHALRYSVGGNISFVKSEVTGLGRGGEPVLSGYVQSANANAAKTDVGQPIASFFGYVTDGIFQTPEEVETHAFQSNETAPGDIRFKDLDGNGVIDVNDRTYIGNPTPAFTYGFNTDFEWKGIELNIFFQGSQGNDIFVNTVRYDFTYVNRPSTALNRWTGPGTSNSEPRVNLSDPNQNARVSDRFVEDGSYLRLKTLQLGYNLPKTWLKKAQIEKMKIYMTGQNLLTFTNYSGLDPEIGNIGGSLEIGIDRGFYPQARTIMGGVSLTF